MAINHEWSLNNKNKNIYYIRFSKCTGNHAQNENMYIHCTFQMWINKTKWLYIRSRGLWSICL